MSVLRNLETKIADLVEGAFGRAFRSEIRPVELARRLTREMDRHRTDSLATTYVPNEYIVSLSAADRRHLAPIEESLLEELGIHLLEHARAQHLALLSRPVIELRTDRRLSLGECGIEARLTHAAAPPAPRVAVGSPQPRASAPPVPAVERTPAQAHVQVGGTRVEVGSLGAIIGRSHEADIVLDGGEVSRRHAQIASSPGGGWVLTDLQSTNGVRLNGRPIRGHAPLHDGDVIEVGSVEIVFEVR